MPQRVRPCILWQDWFNRWNQSGRNGTVAMRRFSFAASCETSSQPRLGSEREERCQFYCRKAQATVGNSHFRCWWSLRPVRWPIVCLLVTEPWKVRTNVFKVDLDLNFGSQDPVQKWDLLPNPVGSCLKATIYGNDTVNFYVEYAVSSICKKGPPNTKCDRINFKNRGNVLSWNSIFEVYRFCELWPKISSVFPMFAD